MAIGIISLVLIAVGVFVVVGLGIALVALLSNKGKHRRD